MRTVYALSAKGQQERSSAKPSLPSELGQLLRLIDGERSSDDLLAAMARKSAVRAGGLRWLKASGYIIATESLAEPPLKSRPSANDALSPSRAEPAPSAAEPATTPATVPVPLTPAAAPAPPPKPKAAVRATAPKPPKALVNGSAPTLPDAPLDISVPMPPGIDAPTTQPPTTLPPTAPMPASAPVRARASTPPVQVTAPMRVSAPMPPAPVRARAPAPPSAPARASVPMPTTAPMPSSAPMRAGPPSWLPSSSEQGSASVSVRDYSDVESGLDSYRMLADYMRQAIKRWLGGEGYRYQRQLSRAATTHELLPHLNPLIDAIVAKAGPEAGAEFADTAAFILNPGETE